MKTRDAEREAEMNRGRQIAQRAKRRSDLDRLVDGKKVQIMCAVHGGQAFNPRWQLYGQMNLFYVDGVQVAQQNTDADDYPSEFVLAAVQLAIGATVGFDGVPGPRPTHEMSEEGKEYARMLRESNKGRSDIGS